MSTVRLTLSCIVDDFLHLLGPNTSVFQHVSSCGDGDAPSFRLTRIAPVCREAWFLLIHFQFQEQTLRMQAHNWHHYCLFACSCNSVVWTLSDSKFERALWMSTLEKGRERNTKIFNRRYFCSGIVRACYAWCIMFDTLLLLKNRFKH